jgi:hypothetical protein
MGSNRGVFDKTSCASGTPASMKIGSADSHVETGQSVIQATVVGDCLKVSRKNLPFNMETWGQGGLRYFVIGNASAAGLDSLAKLFRAD